MADNKTSASKARSSVKTEDDDSFTSKTNTTVKAEHISSAPIPTTPVSPSFKLQMCGINLSEYQSDGTYQKPVQVHLQYRSNDTILLNELTCVFNRGHHVAALGFWARCIDGVPNRYALYDRLIYGHPKGPTESYKHLAEHVVSIIKGDIAHCACPLCTGPIRVLGVSEETSGHSEQ
ncbi:hypothetical protein D6D01_09833 [Aureobasidium pullulans]|uniref:Cryptic loci regulator 2 N-terminal domain-containing protein n=1 Tax=Aureobasidium pullulans TaxID=5580 RepID=A0A4S9JY92_AURPU|nr:hypothetical protein D6D01_09833 [Aureobasidium pullulans]